jgi:hypothetical protein
MDPGAVCAYPKLYDGTRHTLPDQSYSRYTYCRL